MFHVKQDDKHVILATDEADMTAKMAQYDRLGYRCTTMRALDAEHVQMIFRPKEACPKS